MKTLSWFSMSALVILCFSSSVAQALEPGQIYGWGNNQNGQADPPDGNDYIAISANYQHSLALKSDGSVVGWGYNSSGQADPPDGNDYIAIAAGFLHSLALKSDGSIVGWGSDVCGGTTPPEGNDFIAIAAGRGPSMGLKSDGSIVDWGCETPPEGNDFVAIAAGRGQCLALKSDGSIVGWGYNGSGEADPPDGNNYVAIAAGAFFSLALKSDGSIVGWGSAPTPPAGNDYVAITAGYHHALALKSDGSIVGWGRNYSGEATPPEGKGFIALAAGDGYSLAIKRPGVHNITQDSWYYEIQSAIDDANDYDVLVVYPDIYYENIDFNNKDVVLTSLDPNDPNTVEQTVIDGNESGATVTLHGGETSDCKLVGFTITGGLSSHGGGVSSRYSSAEISRCVFVDNHAVSTIRSSYGGAIHDFCGLISNCIFTNNSATSTSSLGSGGALSLCYGTIRNCLIYDNEADCGGGLDYCSGEIINCTIADNTAGSASGLYQCDANITNCIIWGNNMVGCATPTYSCFSGGTGTNIDSDPCFVDADSNDFHLLPDSPCINSGNPDGNYDGQFDIDGDTRVIAGFVDMGADETLMRVHNTTKNFWYPTINEALEDANECDTIVVYPGTYYESVDTEDYNVGAGNDDLVIRGSDPNDWAVVEATVIDGNGADNTFLLRSNALDFRFAGLTVAGGARGVYCTNGYPQISNCIIRDNGRGVEIDSSAPAVNNCIIKDNTNEGITVGSASTAIKNCLISGNDTGMQINAYCGPLVHNCTIVDNTSYGVRRASPYCGASIKNCILWNNGEDVNGFSATFSCISDGDVGDGNIDDDPCFIVGDEFYHLQSISPCIDAGDPAGDYNDQTDIDNGVRTFGEQIDMGSDETTYPDGHWWKLDEDTGTTAYDSIDDDNGIFNGTNPNWVGGVFGGAIECNGVNDYFSIPSLDGSYQPYYTTTFSVAGWFKTEQSTGIQTIVGNWNQYEVVPGVSLYFGWQILVENGKVVARLGPASTSTSDVTGTSDVNDGQWHHFVFVFGAQFEDSYLYVDGQLDADPNTVYGILSDTKFRIGDGSYASSGDPVIKGGPFNGTIDDIMIFDYTLNAGEADQLYRNGL